MNASNLYSNRIFLYLQKNPLYDGLVLRKEPTRDQPTLAQIKELNNEYGCTDRLTGVPGICQAACQIEPLESGREDIGDRLQIPAKLYGRETETAQLLEALEWKALGRSEHLPVALAVLIGRIGI